MITITRADLEDIKRASTRYNAAHDITGLLMHAGGHFVQFLEGEEQEVRFLFEKIVQDNRHDHIKLLFERKASERIFTDWSMPVIDLDRHGEKERNDMEDLVHMAGYQLKDRQAMPMDLQILYRFRNLLGMN